VVVQSFSPESLRILREELRVELPLTLLVGSAEAAAEWLTVDGLADAARFVEAVGPTKDLLLDDPTIVARAHAAGLGVVPWTFRSGDTGRFASPAEEMSYFLYDLGVDALFTNNPDLFPRARVSPGR
jgi:glycerophosphoryl diester phosphodiesterase